MNLNRLFSLIIPFVFFVFNTSVWAQHIEKPDFSKAGFWEVENSGRRVYDFNVGWRFNLGASEGAQTSHFDDASWPVVNTPHGLEYISPEASGCNNYQGEAWYRKHFTLNEADKHKIITLHFEGVMGKCKVWLNGKFLTEHFGGYLPFTVSLSSELFQENNVLAVWADNSDDPLYPPGKAQDVLDFSYFGGIYRDVWMTTTNEVYVSNANGANQVAGGGIFTHVQVANEQESKVFVQVDVRNVGSKTAKIKAKLRLLSPQGDEVYNTIKPLSVKAGSSNLLENNFSIDRPELWTPWSPNLYRLEVILLDQKGVAMDGVATRIGMRTIEFRGKDGFFLNGEPYPGKLMGANRHQDHAYVGNAMPNNAQWRDAKILKNASCDIVRAAHYPADPAFMDACDELGLFFIVATPGWQFWSKEPIFEQRVYQDIREMVRRDRNYACVLMWEPILNETSYPDYFAKKTHDLVHEEYPFSGAYTVCDRGAKGQEVFDVIYSHPGYKDGSEQRSVFTREWGDNTDDWNAHNSPGRVARSWGEHAQLRQALDYASIEYNHTTWEKVHNTPPQHIGGALWHSFDHQRGYHPDPFYGGITDIYRQPKYSYELFSSQRDVSELKEPMVFVANEMSPFSDPEVHVFTNCEAVRLIILEKDTLYQDVSDSKMKIPHPVLTFENAYNFKKVKNLTRKKRHAEASIIAEGIIGGEVVVTHKRVPSYRASALELKLEDDGVPLTANGSDFVRVVAYLTDQFGEVKRLNNSTVVFSVSGEGNLIGDESVLANPKRLEWGTAPLLVRSTLKPGKITVRVKYFDEGIHTPSEAILKFESVAKNHQFLYSEVGVEKTMKSHANAKSNLPGDEGLLNKVKALEKELNSLKLKEVERQQSDFENGGVK